jgi:hypothetical protein
LGTSTAADAKIYFNDLDKHLKHFHAMQEGDKELIELAFSKKKADDRKEWLRTYRVSPFARAMLIKSLGYILITPWTRFPFLISSIRNLSFTVWQITFDQSHQWLMV